MIIFEKCCLKKIGTNETIVFSDFNIGNWETVFQQFKNIMEGNFTRSTQVYYINLRDVATVPEIEKNYSITLDVADISKNEKVQIQIKNAVVADAGEDYIKFIVQKITGPSIVISNKTL